MSRGMDVITAEVVRNFLVEAARDMKRTIMRTSMSPIIYEVLDFSTGMFDRRGRLIAQASGLAIFLGTLDWAVRAAMEKFSGDLHPGDVIISNDPYKGGGTHLNDVAMVKPVFHRDELAGFSAVRAHWLDLGGKAAFSQMTDATEIYQEGLQFPVIKLRDRGQPDQQLLEFIGANVRQPHSVLGDLEAQIAACGLGERRMIELFDRYGRRTVDLCTSMLMDDTERQARKQIAAIPDGVYLGEDYLDSAGSCPDPVAIRVRVEKQGTDIVFDFSESDNATRSSYNMGYCALTSASRVILKSIIDPSAPTNDGSFRPLEVRSKPGTVVHAVRPTPVCMYGDTGRRVIDAVWKALAPALPQGLPAGHYGSVCAQGLAGWDERSGPPRYAMHGGPNAGGWGAWNGGNGENALICISNGDTRNTPVEIIEAKNPLLVRRYELDQDSGGPGKFRGGLGTVIEYLLTDGSGYTGTFIVGRHHFAPFGAQGGHPGRPNDAYLVRDQKRLGGLPGATNFPLRRGDVVVMVAGGGGGWGDPHERETESVLEDLRMGYISPYSARRYYGLDLSEQTPE